MLRRRKRQRRFWCRVFVEISFRAVFHFDKSVCESCFFKTVNDKLLIVINLAGYILTELQTKQFEVLEHNREDVHILSIIVLANINAVKQNFSLGGVIQAAQQFDKRGFTASVHTYNGKTFTDLKFHIDVAKRIVVAARIFERYIAELNLIFSVTTFFYRKASLVHIVGNIKEVKGQLKERCVVAHKTDIRYKA